MARPPAGAAAQRLEVAAGLRELPTEASPPVARLAAAAVAVAVAVGLTGSGAVRPEVGGPLWLLGTALYLALWRLLPGAYRGARSRGALGSWGPMLIPAVCVVGAALVAQEPLAPPWPLALAAWVALTLSAGPWLDRAASRQRRPGTESTLLTALLVSLPIPYLAVALTPGLPAVVAGLAVATGCLLPSWRMVRLAGPAGGTAVERALIVALLTGAALTAAATSEVAGPLMVLAILVGWYGLTGIVSLRDRSELPSFAAFVVVAAAVLAISAPA